VHARPAQTARCTTPRRKIESALKPVKLTIIDESHKHAGHAGNPGGGADAETHFKCAAGLAMTGAAATREGTRQARPRSVGACTSSYPPPPSRPPRRAAPRRAAPCCRVSVVSEEFAGKRLVQRHQMLYRLLDDEIKAGVHALSMETKTPDEAGL
jgi:stress-induced morphogen